MDNSEKQWKTLYKAGATATFIVLVGIILDMVIGNITGGDVSALPQTAVDRFNQFRESELLGLYNLDLLNTITQIIFIPAFVALYGAHRNTGKPYAFLALILFLVGTTVFITGNTSLTMLELSHRYSGAASDEQRLLYAAAGEAKMAKEAHASPVIMMINRSRDRSKYPVPFW